MMTEGQTFYAILFGLYLLNSFKTGSKSSFLIRKKWLKGWSLGRPLTYLGGIQKSLFFTHFSPVHRYSIIASENKGAKLVRLSSLTRLVRIIERQASKIRSLSFVVFYLYFIIIPWHYYLKGESTTLFLFILVAAILPVFIAFWYFRIHMRLDPLNRGERWKQVMYSVVMPWHVMRLADYLFSNAYFRKIHPLSMLSLASGEDSECFVGQLYRDAKYLTRSQYSLKLLDDYLSLSKIDSSLLTKPPVSRDVGEVKYCPCCLAVYTELAGHCEECENIGLLRL